MKNEYWEYIDIPILQIVHLPYYSFMNVQSKSISSIVVDIISILDVASTIFPDRDREDLSGQFDHEDNPARCCCILLWMIVCFDIFMRVSRILVMQKITFEEMT